MLETLRQRQHTDSTHRQHTQTEQRESKRSAPALWGWARASRRSGRRAECTPAAPARPRGVVPRGPSCR
eukprot:216530-Rhodomonas_salina.2